MSYGLIDALHGEDDFDFFFYCLSLEVTPSTITFQVNYSSEYFPPRWISELLCLNI